MAENSWPFYGLETNETQFSKWARTLAHSGIADGLAVTAGSGLQVRLASGTALVRGVFYENTASLNLAVGAAPSTGGRKDAVVLRLDQSGNVITALVKPGSANSSGGSLPALAQSETTYELLLATISIPAGAGTVNSGMIEEARPSVGLRVYPYDSTARRPSPGEPVALGVHTGSKRLELWLAGSWSNLLDFANIAGTLGLSQGGTGQTTAKGALRALGIYIQPTDPGHAKGRVWIPGTAPN